MAGSTTNGGDGAKGARTRGDKANRETWSTTAASMGELEYVVVPAEAGNMPADFAQALAYWQDKKGDRLAPAWGDFKLHELPPSVIPMAVVVDVIAADPANEGLRFVYRFWGTGRAALYGRENKGEEVRNGLPAKSGHVVAEQYSATVEARAPVLFRNTYPLRRKALSMLMTLRLPLSSDNETIDMVVALATQPDRPETFVAYVNPDEAAATTEGSTDATANPSRGEDAETP